MFSPFFKKVSNLPYKDFSLFRGTYHGEKTKNTLKGKFDRLKWYVSHASQTYQNGKRYHGRFNHDTLCYTDKLLGIGNNSLKYRNTIYECTVKYTLDLFRCIFVPIFGTCNTTFAKMYLMRIPTSITIYNFEFFHCLFPF